jgi:hypothetical protein
VGAPIAEVVAAMVRQDVGDVSCAYPRRQRGEVDQVAGHVWERATVAEDHREDHITYPGFTGFIDLVRQVGWKSDGAIDDAHDILDRYEPSWPRLIPKPARSYQLRRRPHDRESDPTRVWPGTAGTGVAVPVCAEGDGIKLSCLFGGDEPNHHAS